MDIDMDTNKIGNESYLLDLHLSTVKFKTLDVYL